MSLIGSLEDLGLGDILQIIHLSQKSGVLSIRGEVGEGRIVMQDGMVRLASLKGDPDDLHGLLVDPGFVSAEDFETAANSARGKDTSLAGELSKLTSIDEQRLDSLRREWIEHAVAEMFSWSTGEFSFDVGAEGDYLSGEMALTVGVSAQYLAMESVRIADERGREGKTDPATGEASDPTPEIGLNLDLSAREMFGVAEEEETDPATSMDTLVSRTTERIERDCEALDDPEVVRESIDPLSGSEPVLEVVETGESIAGECLPPVVVIDDRLSVLEWVRQALSTNFSSVHTFQRSQEGLGRIRQYLARAQTPILLVSPDIEGNPLSGIVDARDFVQRLRGQAPRMPILWLLGQDEADGSELPVVLPTAVHPSLEDLQDGRDEQRLQSLAESMVASLTLQTAEPAVADRSVEASSDDLERLKLATEALCDASSRGEILPLAIRFAAQSFDRVAMFMVRENQVLGMAQHGIDRTGGPDDVEMRTLCFKSSESSWFAEVIESRSPVRAGVRNAGDQRLCELIGGRAVADAYIAPILSAEQVVALLYADNGQRPVGPGDTSALEVVLHHAGLALDRAALARALAEVSDEKS